ARVVWWAGVIFSGRISRSSTAMPRRASCHAASDPARPAPTTRTDSLIRSMLSAAPAAGLGAGVPLRERDERPDRWALRALRCLRPILVAPVGPGDVEVGPLGAVLDRGVQECRGLDRAALAAGAVGEVRDVA